MHLDQSRDVLKRVKMWTALSMLSVQWTALSAKYEHHTLTIIVPMRWLSDMSAEQIQQVDNKIQYDYVSLVSESVQVIAWV